MKRRSKSNLAIFNTQNKFTKTAQKYYKNFKENLKLTLFVFFNKTLILYEGIKDYQIYKYRKVHNPFINMECCHEEIIFFIFIYKVIRNKKNN